MIHIATVHWKTDKWIGVQQSYLRRHLRSPYRVYGWLNDVPAATPEAFHYVCRDPVDSHAVKLNRLAEVIGLQAAADDVLVFLDGDAFPIGDLESLIAQKLPAHRLIAVQRLENNGERQPHPCFCATSVGFWRSIGGDWSKGHEWRDHSGTLVSDVGGNLLGRLEAERVDWFPLLRSNKRNPHPVLFALYHDLVYHHGAGFRPAPLTRDDMARADGRLHWLIARLPFPLRRTVRQKLRGGRHRQILADNLRLSEQIFGRIVADPRFYAEFL
jgi:hypothetical protein